MDAPEKLDKNLRQTDIQTGRQTDRQADKPTDRGENLIFARPAEVITQK